MRATANNFRHLSTRSSRSSGLSHVIRQRRASLRDRTGIGMVFRSRIVPTSHGPIRWRFRTSRQNTGGRESSIARLTEEGLVGVTEAYEAVGIRQSYWSAIRHAVHGLRAPDGTTVKLESLKVGGRRMTSKQAVCRFIERLNSPEERTKRGENACSGRGGDDPFLKSEGLGRDDL